MSCIYKYKGKDYTKDEFYSLVRTTMVQPRTNLTKPLEKQLDKKEIQNNILDIYLEVMQKQETLDKVLRPISFKELEDISKEINISKPKNVNPNSDMYKRDQYQQSRSAGIGIGVKSLDVVFNAVAQQAGNLYIRRRNDKQVLEKDYVVFKDGNKVIQSSSLSNPYTVMGPRRYKSDILSDYQNAALDSPEVLGMINSNAETFDAERALAMLGFPSELIAKFISQPIIVDYAKAMMQSKSSTNVDYKTQRQILEDLYKKYRDRFAKLHSNTTANNFVVNEDDATSIEELTQSLNKGEEYKYFFAVQLHSLAKFEKLTKIGKDIAQLQRTINSDASGVGKNMFSLIKKANDIQQMDVDRVANARNLIGEYTFETIIPNTIVGFPSIYGTYEAYKTYLNPNNGVFPYQLQGIKSIFEVIEEVTGNDLTPDKQKDVWNEFKSFLYSSNNFRLFENEDIEDERKRLFFNDGGLAKILYDYKSKTSNQFITALNTTVYKKGNKASLITYNASAAENLDENNLYTGFIDLVVNPQEVMEGYTTGDLAKDLVKYAFLSGGIQKANEFVKYIPIEYLLQLGFGEDLRNIEKNLNSENYSNFVLQYFQHNPEYAPRLSEDKPEGVIEDDILIMPKIGESPEAERFVRKYRRDGEDIVEYPQLIAKFNNRRARNYDLYIRDIVNENGTTTYVRIHTAGDRFYKEYNAQKDAVFSNIDNNKSPYDFNDGTPSARKPDVEPEHLKNVDNNEFLQLARRGLGHGDIKKALGIIEQKAKRSGVKALAKLFKENIPNIPFSITTTDVEGLAGRYNPNKGISIFINQFDNLKNSFNRVYDTILHESTHAITSEIIDNYFNNPNLLTAEQKKAVRNLDSLRKNVLNKIKRGEIEGLDYNSYERLKALVDKEKKGKLSFDEVKERQDLTGDYYYLYNLKEFSTQALTEKHVQERLNNIKADNKTIFEKFLDIIVDLINSIVPGVKKNSVLEQTIYNTIVLIKGEPDTLPFVMALDDASYSTSYDASYNSKDKTYSGVIVSLKNRIKQIEQSIANSTDKLNISYLNRRKEDLEERLESIQNEKSISNILDIARQELDEVNKLLFSSRLSSGDLDYINKILKLWRNADEYILDEFEKLDKSELREQVSKISGEANNLHNQWLTIGRDMLYKVIADRQGADNIVKEDIIGAQKELDYLPSRMLDISRSRNVILSTVSTWMRDASFDTNTEALELNNKIDNVFKNISKNDYELLLEKDSKGNLTGDLVDVNNYEYIEEKRKRLSSAISKKTSIGWKEYHSWVKENHIVVDIRKMVEVGEDGMLNLKDDLSAYEKELQQQIAKEGLPEDAKVLIEDAKEKIENYNSRLEAEILRSAESPNAELDLSTWKAKHNPLRYLNQLDGNDTAVKLGGSYISNTGYNSVTTITKSKWRSEAYNNIRNNKDLLEAHTFMLETIDELLSYLPNSLKRGLRYNSLPQIPKSVIEQFTKEGMRAGVSGLGDWFKRLISVDASESLYTDNENKLKVIGVLPPEKGLGIENRSFNLPKIMTMFAHSALAYKHKSKVEDHVKLAQMIIHEAREKIINPKGEQLFNEFGEPETKEGLVNLKAQLDYAIEAFYGNRRDRKEGITNKKVYTKEELVKKREIEQKMAEAESTEEMNVLETQLENLGRNVSAGKMGDGFLKVVQLKGMAWNVFTGVTNMLFGHTSNMVWAAGGEEYNMNQLLKATAVMFNSTLKSVALNTISTATGRKIEALMTKYDVLKEVNEAEYTGNTVNNNSRKGLKQLAPFELQRRSEYFVQGQTMIAMMLNTKINDKNGNESTLWEAYDTDGKLKEEFRTEENIKNWETVGNNISAKNFKAKLDNVIQRVHGNYDPNSPVLVKKSVLGRALMQFRSWISEGVANRFESAGYDERLGRVTKGRWRSYKLEHLLIVPLINDIKKAFSKEGGLSKEDASNMRKNAMELMQYIALIGTYYGLKALSEGEDDDRRKYINNFMLNQMIRLQSDMEFFINPVAFESISRNAIPAFSVVIDAAKLGDALSDAMQGEDEITTGIYAGQSKVKRRAAKLFPGTTQYIRTESAFKNIFDRN